MRLALRSSQRGVLVAAAGAARRELVLVGQVPRVTAKLMSGGGKAIGGNATAGSPVTSTSPVATSFSLATAPMSPGPISWSGT